MGRPASTTPNKKKLTLTVSARTRVELDFISKESGKSISVLLEEFASKESKRIARAAKKAIPNSEQLKIDYEA